MALLFVPWMYHVYSRPIGDGGARYVPLQFQLACEAAQPMKKGMTLGPRVLESLSGAMANEWSRAQVGGGAWQKPAWCGIHVRNSNSRRELASEMRRAVAVYHW